MKKTLLTIYFGLAIWLGNTALFFLMDIFLRAWAIEQAAIQPIIILLEIIFIAKKFPRESSLLSTPKKRIYFAIISSPAIWYYGCEFLKFLFYTLNSYKGRYVGTMGMELYFLIFAVPVSVLFHCWLLERRCQKLVIETD